MRLPEDLKLKCEKIAENEGLSLNEWIKRTLLNVACSGYSDNLNHLMNMVDNYVRRPNVANVHSRIDFLTKAIDVLLYSSTCSVCGAVNYGQGQYCRDCGEDSEWEHPCDKYAVAYFHNFWEENPLPEGWRYRLTSPSRENPENEFYIAKYTGSDYTRDIIVKKLSDEDIEEGKILYDKKVKEGKK